MKKNVTSQLVDSQQDGEVAYPDKRFDEHFCSLPPPRWSRAHSQCTAVWFFELFRTVGSPGFLVYFIWLTARSLEER